jgi:hypothetical protein
MWRQKKSSHTNRRIPMASRLNRYVLRPISRFFKGADVFLTKLFTKKLKKQLLGAITDEFITLLLRGMDLFFCLNRDSDFRRNLENFDGRYFFKTADEAETIRVSATFSNGNMHVHEDAIDDWDVMVTFKDGEAMRNFISSEKQDIFDSISRNSVEVDGNLNYIFKFGFMARDILQRLNLALE